jgi:hypothetical protein
MRPIPCAVLALLVASAVAGCVAPDEALSDPGIVHEADRDVFAAVRALLTEVPCEAGTVGAGPTKNLLQLANLSNDEGLHAELDFHGDLMLWARYGAGGFEVLNTSDPLEPRLVGQYLEEGGALDVKFSPDGKTAFVGHGGGVEIVDVSDPTLPQKTGFWTFPEARPWETLRNAHMLTTARIAEADWLFIAPNANSGIHILKIEGAPGAVTLTKVAETMPVQGGPLGPHDMTVQFDPVLKSWILYSADGFEGWSAWDVDDPSEPQMIARLPNLEPFQGYTHTIQAAHVGDRRLVATIAEVGHNALKVYDATNLMAPVLVGTWQAATGDDSLAPQHNLHVVGDNLYVAHYQRGFYVFNLTDVPTLPMTGFAQLAPMAHWTRNTDGTQGPVGFNGVWEVVVKDGVLYVSDVDQFRVFGFGCITPGDAAQTSFG